MQARQQVRNALAFSGVLLAATAAVILVGPQDHAPQEWLALAAGLATGIWLLRFAPAWRWLSAVVLLLAFVLLLVLGPLGIAWIGGFVSGTQAGLAWRQHTRAGTKSAGGTRSRGPRPAAGRQQWTVDGRSFTSSEEARNATRAAVRALDPVTGGTVKAEYGSARLEIAGSLRAGVVCHRNPRSDDESTWTVLGRSGPGPDATVEVPMGRRIAVLPARLVQQPAAAEAAIEDFFANPGGTPSGPGWLSGDEAESSRLTTY